MLDRRSAAHARMLDSVATRSLESTCNIAARQCVAGRVLKADAFPLFFLKKRKFFCFFKTIIASSRYALETFLGVTIARAEVCGVALPLRIGHCLLLTHEVIKQPRGFGEITQFFSNN